MARVSPRVDLYEAVKYDMRLHGPRVIIAEFAAATVVAGLLAAFEALRPDRTATLALSALWFAGFALNSLAVVALAMHARRGPLGSSLREHRLHLHALALVVLLLVPAAVALAALAQWLAGDLSTDQSAHGT